MMRVLIALHFLKLLHYSAARRLFRLRPFAGFALALNPIFREPAVLLQSSTLVISVHRKPKGGSQTKQETRLRRYFRMHAQTTPKV